MAFIFIPGVNISDISFDIEPENKVSEVLELLEQNDVEIIDCSEMPVELQDLKFDATTPIPEEYFNYEDWPKQSEYACWTCGCYFDSVPWFVPASWTKRLVKATDKKYKNIIGNDQREVKVISVHGNFCTVFCVRRYIEESPEILHKKNHLNMLHLIYKEFTGHSVDFIPMAYPKTIMKKYMGRHGLTELDFKKKNEELVNEMLRFTKK